MTVFCADRKAGTLTTSEYTWPVLSLPVTSLHAHFDKGVATLWSTLDNVRGYSGFSERYYLVQNFETDFYRYGNPLRTMANASYLTQTPLHYITISKWCETWLRTRFGQKAAYAPNGIDVELFAPVEHDFSGKIRILVEGNSDDHYKNVDESFHITNALDRDRYEIWYLSYAGKPKPWYRVDRFFHKVPYPQVPEIYGACHILVKSSLVESFSYPPIEMMATGGCVVVAPNPGNAEYVRNGENCLIYKQGDFAGARAAIERLATDSVLRDALIAGGLQTAASRRWASLEARVVDLYRASAED